MVDFRADLHCHTTVSDGSLTPTELVELASAKGLQGLSITDHDSIGAYREALPVAKEKGIRLLPGVEFSCIQRDTSVHILAYGFQIDNQRIENFCELHKKRRMRRFVQILERLTEHEIFLDKEEILSTVGNMPGRPHIAQAMVSKGYVRDLHSAFKCYIGEKGCAYVPSMSYSVKETLSVIHQSGGLAVIAHPILIKKQNVYRDMLAMNFDGIEGFYARFRRDQETPYIMEGEKRGFFITGGSDFHGDAKPRIDLGCSWAPSEVFEQLWLHYKKGRESETLL